MDSMRMRGATTGYTRIVSRSGDPRRPTCDFLLSDEGVLYLATRSGTAWRCLGLVNPEELLDDLGLLDGSAAGLTVEDVPPRAFAGQVAL